MRLRFPLLILLAYFALSAGVALLASTAPGPWHEGAEAGEFAQASRETCVGREPEGETEAQREAERAREEAGAETEAQREREAGAETEAQREREAGAETEAQRERESGCETLADVERELTEPGDAMLRRTLFGSGETVPTDVWARAVARSRAIRAASRSAGAGFRGSAGSWEDLGPTQIGGRILDVAIDPERANTIYVATAGGGVWKSTNAGKTLTPAWPIDLTQNIGALVITKSGVLYAGTGEAGPGGGSLTYGGTGMYKSTDRGATWTQIGLQDASRFGRIVVDPTNENRIYAAVTGTLYKPGGTRGLYRSEDAGATWTQILKGDNDTTGVADIAIDPSDPKHIFATTWDAQRGPNSHAYTGVGSGVYESKDDGATFARISNPAFASSPALGRIGVTFAPSDPKRVYLISTVVTGRFGGVWRSTDGGATFLPGASANLLLSASSYSWWFGRIWADPTDADRVFVAGVSLTGSTDGGLTWGDVTGSAHADQHAMAWDPKVPGRVYLGNDGGIYRSDDNGAGNWEHGDSHPFSQLYGLDVGEQDPTRRVAGLQDNGVVRNYDGAKKGEWNEFGGGDGQRTLINPKDQEIVYGCSQYGACFVSKDGGSTQTDFTNQVVSTRKNWFTPIEFDPADPSIVYTGGEIMSRSQDDGATWTPISPDLSSGPYPPQDPDYRNYGTITTIAPAGLENGTIYAGTDDGNLWYTHSGGGPTGWTKASDPDLPEAWVTRVEIDRRKPSDVAYVTYSGFRTGEDAAYLLRTKDGGKTWDNITGDLPRAPLNDVNLVGDTLVVASEVGVFFSADQGAHWYAAGGNLPIVPVMELKSHLPGRMLYAGTFGRGMQRITFDALTPPSGTPPVTTAPAKARRNFLGIPRARGCRVPSRVTFKVKGGRGVGLRSAVVRVAGRKVATLRGARLKRPVRLRLPRGKVRVSVTAVTTKGKVVRASRTYKACPKRKKG